MKLLCSSEHCQLRKLFLIQGACVELGEHLINVLLVVLVSLLQERPEVHQCSVGACYKAV